MEVYNNNNILQITDKYSNIQFVDKTTVTLPNKIEQDSYYSGLQLNFHTYTSLVRYYRDITLPTLSKDMFAFRCENDKFVQCFGTKKSDGTLALTVSGEQGAIVTIYRFSYSEIPPGEHFEVRSVGGKVVFSDKGKFMKVIDSKQGSRIRPTTLGSTIDTTDHDPNKIVAVSTGNLSWEVTYVEYLGMVGAIDCQSFKFNSGQLISTFESYYAGGTDTLWYDYTVNYQYLVIDVTGL